MNALLLPVAQQDADEPMGVLADEAQGVALQGFKGNQQATAAGGLRWRDERWDGDRRLPGGLLRTAP